MDLRFTVLGSVRGWRAGAELDLGPPQQRTLTALLLVRAGQLVSVAEITGVLWRDDPPPTAVNVIHRHVGQLRRLLEPQLPMRSAGSVLARVAGGYRLQVASDVVDLLRFRGLWQAARAAGDDTAASRLLLAALAEWEGECAAGLDADARSHPVFAACDREYVSTLCEAADVAVRSGTTSGVLPRLQDAAARSPLDEPLQARLIRALAASGRQAEALHVYTVVRTMLAEELGMDPGPDLRAAHEAVLRQQTAPAQVISLGSPAADPASPQEPLPVRVRPAQLPPDTAMFTGRRAELSRALALPPAGSPTAAAIAAITGPAGVGKTTFALRWAHQIAGRFPGGQLYVDLRAFAPDGRIVAAEHALRLLLTALEVPADRVPSGVDAKTALYRSLLAGRRMLVMLDNARDADHVRPLLPASGGCLTLVTSRNDLAGLLAVEGAHPFVLDVMDSEQALEYLDRRLGAQRLAAEPAATADIVRLCAGLPLALAIVASRLAARPNTPLAAAAEQLREARGGLDGFTGHGSGADVRAAFSWSLDRLDPAASRLFALLGLHPGEDIGVASAAALAGQPPRAVRPLLDELVAGHLLAEHALGRYGFHDLLRAYAAELAADAAAAAPARDRLLDHYLHTAHAADRLLMPERAPIDLQPAVGGAGPEPMADAAAAAAWLRREITALLGCVDIADGAGLHARTWRLVWAANAHLRNYGDPLQILQLQEVAHAAIAPGRRAAAGRP